MIEARDLVKNYGPKAAVKGISFNIEKGEVVGFLGPNGAGKTTTMRMLTGYFAPSAGSAAIGGFDMAENPMEAKRLIGYLPEHPPLYDDLTVSEFLRFAARLRGVARSKVKARLDAVVESCGLGEVSKRLIGNISKGYKQRTGLAQALIHDPPVLILDEPTVGLDPKQIVEIRSLIKGLGRERTVLLSTHILPEVAMTCERVLIVHRGELRAEDRIENLTRRADRVFLDVRGAGNAEDVLGALRGAPGVESAEERDGGTSFEAVVSGEAARAEMARAVVGKGWALHEMRSEAKTLEDVFLELTKEDAAV